MTERRGMSTSTNPADTVWEQDASPAPSQDISELVARLRREVKASEMAGNNNGTTVHFVTDVLAVCAALESLTSRVEEAEARKERLRERIGAAYEILDNKYLPAEDRVGAALAALDQPPTPSEDTTRPPDAPPHYGYNPPEAPSDHA